jgi:hypothetical protein
MQGRAKRCGDAGHRSGAVQFSRKFAVISGAVERNVKKHGCAIAEQMPPIWTSSARAGLGLSPWRRATAKSAPSSDVATGLRAGERPEGPLERATRKKVVTP